MAPRKYKKNNSGMKIVEIHINTHFIKVCAWGFIGAAGCFAFFKYIPIGEHMKPVVEAFATGLFGKIGDSIHKNES